MLARQKTQVKLINLIRFSLSSSTSTGFLYYLRVHTFPQCRHRQVIGRRVSIIPVFIYVSSCGFVVGHLILLLCIVW